MSAELIERNRAIAHDYVDGKSMQEIADEYDITRARVQQIINAAGIVPSQAMLDREGRIVEMIRDGMALCEITAAANCNEKTARDAARRNGLTIARKVSETSGSGSAWKILADLITTTTDMRALAEKHGVSYASVAATKRKAMLAGIPLHPDRQYRADAGSTRKETASCGG